MSLAAVRNAAKSCRPTNAAPSAGHRGQVESLGDKPGIARLHRIGDGTLVDAVSIRLATGLVACVKRLGLRLHLHDADIVGQLRVERAPQRAGLNRMLELEARDLTAGMNTGIRPTGPVHGHGTTLDISERIFESSLHGINVRLTLPSGVGRSVVRDCQLERSHGGGHPKRVMRRVSTLVWSPEDHRRTEDTAGGDVSATTPRPAARTTHRDRRRPPHG